jgi:1,4-dihydroxy-2-naphthoate octaprenyltransferase
VTGIRTAEPDTGNARRFGIMVGAQGFSWLMLAFGLIAPLTPSDGPPSWIAVAIWLGVPVLLIAFAASRAKAHGSRLLIACEALAMILLTWKLTLSVR